MASFLAMPKKLTVHYILQLDIWKYQIFTKPVNILAVTYCIQKLFSKFCPMHIYFVFL
jgi:hypothetical protein